MITALNAKALRSRYGGDIKGNKMEGFTDHEFRKPPLGLTPRPIIDKERCIEILEASLRYVNSYKKIPNDWIQELIGINRRTKK